MPVKSKAESHYILLHLLSFRYLSRKVLLDAGLYRFSMKSALTPAYCVSRERICAPDPLLQMPLAPLVVLLAFNHSIWRSGDDVWWDWRCGWRLEAKYGSAAASKC